MKASFKTILFVILITFLFHSDNSYSQLKNLGIKSGLNLSSAELQSRFFTSFKGVESKTGFNIYLTYDFLNFENLIFSGEAGYSQKGFDKVVPLIDGFGNQTSSYTIYNRLNYIDVNAIAQFILRNKSISPYISLGPVISFYTGYKTSTTLEYFEQQIIEFVDLYLGHLKSPVLGLISGVGIEIDKVIPQTIIAEARFNFDFGNNGYLNYERNYVWQFNVGIKL
jgi:hypothetical protein